MYNNYLGNNQYGGQFYPSYMNYGNYGNVQMPQRQMQPQQPQQPIEKEQVPFNDIRFATEDEAKAYIVMPNTKVMFMDRDKSVFYIKSADSLGKSTLECYSYTRSTNNSTEPKNSVLDPKEFVKTSDLKNFITKDDLGNFLTRDDLKPIDTKLQELQRRIKINDIMAEGNKNGKQ